MGINKRKTFITSAVLFFVFLLFLVLNSLLISEEARIKKLIYAAKRAVEKEDLLKCISFISFDYADEYSNERRALLLVGRQIFKAYDDIAIFIKKLKIKVNKDLAEAEVEALGKGKVTAQEERLTEGDMVNFKIFFKKEDGWKVIRLEFQERQLSSFTHEEG